MILNHRNPWVYVHVCVHVCMCVHFVPSIYACILKLHINISFLLLHNKLLQTQWFITTHIYYPRVSVGQESGHSLYGSPTQLLTRLQVLCQPGLWSHLRLDWGKILFCQQRVSVSFYPLARGFHHLLTMWAPQHRHPTYGSLLLQNQQGSLMFSCISNFFYRCDF